MKRRGNGEGLIRKRSDGRWEARVTLPDGKTKAFYAKTRAEVAERLATALHEIKQGVPQADGKQSFGHYMNIWFPTTKAHIRQSTYRRYGDYVRVHIVPGLGKHTLAKLNAQHLQLFYARKIDEGLSSTTVHHIHGVIHRALEDAQRMGLVQRNVSEMVKARRRSHREMRTLSPEEVRRFLDEVHGDRWEALYLLAFSTGVREGELLGLRWQDIDFAHRRLHVRMNVQETLGRYILAETKTTYARRTLGLILPAVTALQLHWERQQAEKKIMGAAYDDNLDLVFANGFGGIMIPHNITKRSFKRHLVAAALPRSIRFHDARHTAATLLLVSGVNVKVVSEMLGHADVSITLRVYAHVLPHMQHAAMNAMEALIGELPPPVVDDAAP